MAEKKKLSSKERKVVKEREYRKAYVTGYEDALKSVSGSAFNSTRGYHGGFKDSRKVTNIKAKYNSYKNSK